MYNCYPPTGITGHCCTSGQQQVAIGCTTGSASCPKNFCFKTQNPLGSWQIQFPVGKLDNSGLLGKR